MRRFIQLLFFAVGVTRGTGLANEGLDHDLEEIQLFNVEYEVLKGFTGTASDRVVTEMRNTLQSTGMFTISSVPGLQRIRNMIFNNVLLCIDALEQSDVSIASLESFLETDLQDGSIRQSFAASNQGSSWALLRQEILSTDEESCFDFIHGFELLNQKFKDASKLAVRAVEFLCDSDRLSKSNPIKKHSNSDSEFEAYSSLSNLVDNGSHLHHTHVYKRELNVADDEMTLDFHIDNGLFLLFTPGHQLPDTQTPDFFIKNDGDVKIPSLQPDSIVFMAGDGARNLISPICSFEIKPTLHALRLNAVQRIWSGQMVVPPHDAHIFQQSQFLAAKQSKTMAEHLGSTNHTSPIGCSNEMVLHEIVKGGCAKNEVYCWMQCMPLTPEISPSACAKKGQEMLCANPAGVPWTDGMCTDCKLRCEDKTPKPANPASGGNKWFNYDSSFCNGLNSVMYMNGFTIDPSRRPDDACLVFIIDGLVASDFFSYWFIVLVAFWLGVCVEFVLATRKRYHSLTKDSGVRFRNNSLSLHLVQVVVSYAAMLVTMTYSLMMFSSVCCGIVCGHYWFNFKEKVQDTEACCAFMEDLDTKE